MRINSIRQNSTTKPLRYNVSEEVLYTFWRKTVSKSDISRNNHYVPKFYLEYWGNDNRLWKYQLLVSNEKVPVWSNTATKHTASQDNLYVRMKDNEEVDDIEKIFDADFEVCAKKALDKVINEDRLFSEDWKYIINFVGAQIVRTPAFFQRIRPTIRNAMESSLEEILSELTKEKILASKKNIDEDNELIPINFVDEGASDIEGMEDVRVEAIEGKSTWLWAIKHMLKNNLKYLHEHKWSIITTELEMPTSDDPVLCLNYYSENDYNFDGGWMQKGTEIFLPISPHKIIYTQVGVKHTPRIKYGIEESNLLKKLIVEHAFREIYSNYQDDDIPQIRPRIVDTNLYKEEQESVNNWYDTYLEKEASLLNKYSLQRKVK